jgi:hypothetical protein
LHWKLGTTRIDDLFKLEPSKILLLYKHLIQDQLGQFEIRDLNSNEGSSI